MPAFARLVSLGAVTLGLSFALSACAVDATGDDDPIGETSEEALSSAGGSTTLYYLGSSQFLRQCAGNTLGCGKSVASVSNSTPYFSAPRSWNRTTCNAYYTFKTNGHCVEAQRFEVSDTRNFIEGNPGLFDGLGLTHSDGRNCAGSGQGTVTVTPGRHCP